MIEYVDACPWQLPTWVATLTEYTTVKGPWVLFTKVCAGMVLTPFAAAPVIPAGILAVHEICAFGVVLVIFTAVEVLPEQSVAFAWLNPTDATGFTQTLKVFDCPGHPLLGPGPFVVTV